MPQPMAFIGCGSFNPVTIMHLRMFGKRYSWSTPWLSRVDTFTELAKDHSLKKNPNITVVEGIISPVNDLYPTSKPLASSDHRCKMVQLSLKPLNGKNHWIRVDNWECSQKKWMTTIEVLRHHQKLLNQKYNCHVKLKLVCGADLFESFNVPNLWKDCDIEEILRDYGLVVITRAGSDPEYTMRHSPKSLIISKFSVNSSLFCSTSSTN